MKNILLLFLLPFQLAIAQNEITLEQCYEWARTNYPGLKKEKAWQEILQLNKDNISTSRLPEVNLSGQASFQSDVPGIDISMPGIDIPEVSKDQYKIYAAVKQNIWDGGITDINLQIEESLLRNNIGELEVEMYRLYDQVSEAFFTCLALKKQQEVVSAQRKIMLENLKSMESKVKNGIAEPSSVWAMKAELISLDQKKSRLAGGEKAAYKVLTLLTGKEIEQGNRLINNSSEESYGTELNRPELDLISMKQDLLNQEINLLQKARTPKVFGFGRAGYGKPGLNMLSDNFDPWYIVGIGVSWKVVDWKKSNRSQQAIRLKQENLEHQKETFIHQLQLLIARQHEKIIEIKEVLEKDSELVQLRSAIARASSSKLENETITAAAFIQDIQAETLARLNLELHKIELAAAKEKRNTLIGKMPLTQ